MQNNQKYFDTIKFIKMKKYLAAIAVLSIVLFSCGNGADSKKDAASNGKDSANSINEVIPAESIFNLKDTFKTQDNQDFTLDKLKGKPTVVGMVFTHCGYACPRLTADMVSVSDSLKGIDVNYLLVSFDVARDTPERLKVFANESGLDKKWTLLHGSDDAVRTLSVLLNVQYEKDADGNFSHSNLISVLDQQGRLKLQTEGLEANHSQTISTIKNLAKSKL
jgi:protein SCO1